MRTDASTAFVGGPALSEPLWGNKTMPDDILVLYAEAAKRYPRLKST